MNDIEAIKKAVSKKPLFEPLDSPPSLPIPDEILDIEKRIGQTPKHAPLFIKIEKYKDILEHVNELKSTLSHFKKLSNLRKNIEDLKTAHDEILEKTFERFGNVTTKLDTEFTVPEAMKPFVKEESVEHIDGFIHELEEEITKLKNELESVSKTE